MSIAWSQYNKISTIEEFSKKMVRHYKLPNGSYFSLTRKSFSNSDRPYLRSDSILRRRRFSVDDHPRGDDEKVIDVCNRISEILKPGNWAKVVAFGPSDEKIDGHTLLKTWRAMPSKLGTSKCESLKEKKSSVFIQENSLAYIEKLKRRGYPEEDIVAGILLTLKDIIDPDILDEVVQEVGF